MTPTPICARCVRSKRDPRSLFCGPCLETVMERDRFVEHEVRDLLRAAKALLRHYPEGIFDGSSGDPGPTLMVRLRKAVRAFPSPRRRRR